MYRLLGQLDDRVDQGLLLCRKSLELVAVQLVLEVVVDQSLAHELADDDLDLSALLEESVVLADLDLVVL